VTHGLPCQIISDRGVQFTSKVFKEFLKKLDIKGSMSTAYHPQTDGQTERVNQTLEQYLRIFCNTHQNNWVKFLASAKFAYNNAASESTLQSPFYLEYGYHPWMIPIDMQEFTTPSIEEILNHWQEAQEQAKASMTLAANRAKWYFDQHKQEVPFKVGDKVWLKGADIHVKPTKLMACNYGPYTILEQLGPVTFKLQLPRQMKVHPVFHTSKMIQHRKDEIGNWTPSKLDSVEVEGQPEQEVEEIINSRVFCCKVQYLVKWVGYDNSENSWEPLHNLNHAIESLEDFHNLHPSAPKPTSWTNATPVTPT
jgi:transposase InsO family protein